MNEGVLEWTRLSQLRVGDELVSLKGAADPLEQKQNPGYAPLACPESATTEKTQTRPIAQSDTTESGKKNNAGAENQLKLKSCAVHATQSNSPQQNLPRSKAGLGVSNTGMGLLPKTLYGWLMNAAIGAMSVGNNLLRKTQGRIGAENYVSTTTITPEQFAGYSATTATSQLDMARRQMFSNELRRISDFTTDPIISITPSGVEEVFDVEIDRTENFIANGVVSHNTRWSKRDLTGQVLKASAQRSGEEWEVIEFPAILPSGNAMWPEFWDVKELEALRAELPSSKWQAQYMQQPTSDVSAIIKREWWKIWEEDNPPSCEFIIQSWDTAFLKTERSDFSACTTWGVFYQDDDKGVHRANIILLNAFKKRMEFPELKQRAFQEFNEWEVDSLIVEAKASGSPLIFELRQMGIPVQEYTPTKGNDKIARLNAVADMFASGHVWVPNTHWAEELIEEVASFPSGEHDDLVDSMSQALLRYRRGGFIRLESDEERDELYFRRNRRERYYTV
jgi:predicted phage terminase large subunit-like protein